jgi:hypothetical protein
MQGGDATADRVEGGEYWKRPGQTIYSALHPRRHPRLRIEERLIVHQPRSVPPLASSQVDADMRLPLGNYRHHANRAIDQDCAWQVFKAATPMTRAQIPHVMTKQRHRALNTERLTRNL